MPNLASHHSSSIVKMLVLGDAKAGKTSSLASLVKAGLKLRILDFDNLLDPLAGKLTPDEAATVEFISLRDEYAPGAAGMLLKGKPQAWIQSLKLLNNWKYTTPDGEDIDYGRPADWGPDVVLVIDSLSRWCDAAYNHHSALTPGNDGRAIYGNAQDDMERQLATLTSPNFQTNVIVLCHGVMQDRADGTKKIFPQGIGQALSPVIPQYFPNFIRLMNKAGKRTFQVESNNMIDLSVTKPLPAEIGADEGLAQIFRAFRGQPEDAAPAAARPKSLTLRKV